MGRQLGLRRSPTCRPGGPNGDPKVLGQHISRSSPREFRSRIGSVSGLQPVQSRNCHRATGVRQNAFPAEIQAPWGAVK